MSSQTATDDRREPPAKGRAFRTRWLLATVPGLVAVAVTVAVAELLAALGGWIGLTSTATSASPLAALGATFIELTPEWLKSFAISVFGLYDKLALRVGMGLTIVVLAAALGVLATRKLLAAQIGLGVLGLVVVTAILTRTGSGVIDVLPTVLGLGAGFVALTLLTHRFAPLAEAAANDAEAGGNDRRSFLRFAATGAGVAAVSGGLSALIPTSSGAESSQQRAAAATAGVQVDEMPPIPEGASLDVPGISPFITPNEDFYRIDTAFVVPKLDATTWRLRVHGMVEREITLTYDQLLERPFLERMITLTCVSNEIGGDLVGNAVWQGPLIRDVLMEAGVSPDADMVLSRSSDGFTISTPLEVLMEKDRDAIFAVTMNGEVLPFTHGFPVRMVVPGLYGFVSATKWVVELELTRFDQQTAYWTDRGWAPRAPIKTASRIDVPRSFQEVPAGRFAMGGVAWAQHRGVDAVEVRIDGGDWQPATLSTEVSTDAWRQWSFVWDATPGQHTVVCRATDGTGEVQTAEVARPIPDGATGYDSTVFKVT